MRLHQCRMASGRRMPILVHDGPMAPLPVLVPFLYVQFKLRFGAYNTAAGQLRAIQAFYDYATRFKQLNVDSELLGGRFESLLGCLDGFALWLSGGRQASNLIAQIGVASTPNAFFAIESRTRDQYLGALKTYLIWCANRYLPVTRNQESLITGIQTQFADVTGAITRRFENHILRLDARRPHYRSLTDEQVSAVREVIRLGAIGNPYSGHLQLRNWLMIELLLETGSGP